MFGFKFSMNGSIIFLEQQKVNRASSHSVALSVSRTVCSPRAVGGRLRRWDLEVAAAAWLLLLRFNVFVNLELGFVGMLRSPVLQVPEEQKQDNTQFGKQYRWTFSFVAIIWMSKSRLLYSTICEACCVSCVTMPAELLIKDCISHCFARFYIVVIKKWRGKHWALVISCQGSKWIKNWEKALIKSEEFSNQTRGEWLWDNSE